MARIHDGPHQPPAERALAGHFAHPEPADADPWHREVAGALADAWRVAQLLRHPLRHARLSWRLSRPAMRSFAASSTKLRLKYLVDYAAKSLSTEQRYQVVNAHYTFLQQQFQPQFLHAVSTGAVCVWAHAGTAPAELLSIELDFPSKLHTEGDLCLTLKSGRRHVYRLIFCIAPGAAFGIDQAHIILITCVQGLQGSAGLRAVAAACNDVHPSDLLMAALGGVAGASGIATLVGITTANQIANKGRIFFSYDDFFAKYGRYRATIDAYEIALPFSQKPLSDIAAKYRGRTRAKRSLRHTVSAAAQAALAPFR